MKNILNTKTDGTPALLSNVNESGNSLFVNGTEISSSSWIGEGTYTFTVGTHTYTISKVPDNVGNYQLLKVSDYTYQFVKGDSKRELLDFFYRVGSYYETSDTTFDPNITWGGTWELEAEGLVHVSAGKNYAVSANDKDGGSAQITYTPAGTNSGGAVQGHAITVDEMPSHNHRVGWVTTNNGSNKSATYDGQPFLRSGLLEPNTYQAYSNSKGSGSAHVHNFTQPTFTGTKATLNNMQPYKIVNRWHRVA
jgi:hypothetical protein